MIRAAVAIVEGLFSKRIQSAAFYDLDQGRSGRQGRFEPWFSDTPFSQLSKSICLTRDLTSAFLYDAYIGPCTREKRIST